jgi:hypothetical protein
VKERLNGRPGGVATGTGRDDFVQWFVQNVQAGMGDIAVPRVQKDR